MICCITIHNEYVDETGNTFILYFELNRIRDWEWYHKLRRCHFNGVPTSLWNCMSNKTQRKHILKIYVQLYSNVCRRGLRLLCNSFIVGIYDSHRTAGQRKRRTINRRKDYKIFIFFLQKYIDYLCYLKTIIPMMGLLKTGSVLCSTSSPKGNDRSPEDQHD